MTPNPDTRHYSTLGSSETVEGRDSHNWIPTGTYTRRTHRCTFRITWSGLQWLRKYSNVLRRAASLQQPIASCLRNTLKTTCRSPAN